MTQNVKDLFPQLSMDREELKSTIFSIKEGIVVIDEETEQIVLANDKVKYLSKHRQIEGKPYWEVIKSDSFKSYVEGIWQKKVGDSIEITIDNEHYFCSAYYLPIKKCLLAVFFDVSGPKKLEKEKKDFISNVSHELRTPLTSIKGFVETLLQSVKNETERKYLKIIHRNAERLILMVEDLLTLSDLEKDDKSLDLEIIQLKDFFKIIKQLFQKKAAAKGLSFEVDLEDGLTLKADAYMLEQVFINLIDNAIKYSESGYVKVEAYRKKQVLILAVRDSGIGIPAKHRNRIFQRFYMIDKSRSRGLGGTGLGLSIVKHIVMLHDWEITLSSKVGEGTSFEIVIDAPTAKN